jgi:hypothetical protein
MREKTARLRALRLARDVANPAALPADQKGRGATGQATRAVKKEQDAARQN